MSRLFYSLCGLILLSLASACGGDTWSPDAPSVPDPIALSAQVTIQGSQGPATVTCTVRSTAEERRVGLMHVKDRLKDDTGMLFVMDNDSDHSFWMKNTYIPLDMLFIDVHGNLVGVLEEVTPLTTTGRSVDKISRYVLEVDGGWSKRHGVFAGQHVEIKIAEQQ